MFDYYFAFLLLYNNPWAKTAARAIVIPTALAFDSIVLAEFPAVEESPTPPVLTPWQYFCLSVLKPELIPLPKSVPQVVPVEQASAQEAPELRVRKHCSFAGFKLAGCVMSTGLNPASLQLPTSLNATVRHVWHAAEAAGGRYWAVTMDEDEARAKKRTETMVSWKRMMGRGVGIFIF